MKISTAVSALVIVVVSAALTHYIVGYNAEAESQAKADAVDARKKKPIPLKTTLPKNIVSAWEMPPFKYRGLDGKTHALDEWKGKVILLNFWASWCAPCQAEIKDFTGYQEKFGKHNLQIVSIGLDDEKKLVNTARTLGINYPVLVPEPQFHHDLLAQWGDRSGTVPHNVIIAADGRITYIHRGQFNDAAFVEFVMPLLTREKDGADVESVGSAG